MQEIDILLRKLEVNQDLKTTFNKILLSYTTRFTQGLMPHQFGVAFKRVSDSECKAVFMITLGNNQPQLIPHDLSHNYRDAICVGRVSPRTQQVCYWVLPMTQRDWELYSANTDTAFGIGRFLWYLSDEHRRFLEYGYSPEDQIAMGYVLKKDMY